MTTFSLPWANPDLSLHANPPEGWDRVAVACGWSDARKARERWPHAAVVGPLRTLRGLDLFIRGLLANPQIRVVIWDGPDLTPGEVTKTALFALWTTPALDAGRLPAPFGVDLDAHLDTIRSSVFLHLMRNPTGWNQLTWSDDRTTLHLDAGGHLLFSNADRPGGPVILPPPVPASTERAPHGDPGDRVVADTLADLWPRVLDRALRCGREVDTQSGETRELLNLVSVLRDPSKTLTEIAGPAVDARPVHAVGDGGILQGYEPTQAQTLTQPHPVLGFSFADVEAYAERLTGAKVPEGAAYSYGSRMRGVVPRPVDAHESRGWCWRVGGVITLSTHGVCPECGWSRTMERRPGYPAGLKDQIEAQEALLAADPRTRAAYLTPWRPEDDTGKASGTPCLTGVWFRAVDDALHMTITFRGHDLFTGYPLNVAACCLWLVRLADKLGMSVGTLTCLSMSAYVCVRDMADAQKVVAGYRPPAGPRWDQRAAWRVELVRTETTLQPVGPFETMRAWNDQNRISFEQAMERVEATLLGLGDFVRGQPQLRAGRRLYIRETKADGSLENRDLTPDELTRLTILIAEEAPKLPPMPGSPAFSLRATALTPDGTEILQVFEAKTPEKLFRDIAESGLIQEVGSALWLGREVERVWTGRTA